MGKLITNLAATHLHQPLIVARTEPLIVTTHTGTERRRASICLITLSRGPCVAIRAGIATVTTDETPPYESESHGVEAALDHVLAAVSECGDTH